MSIIDISNLQKAYGSTALLDGVTFTIEEEAKVGFVGMNGCGKSTLFKIVAGLETKDSGNISFKKGASVGYLAQDPYLDESKTINEEIESALKAIREKVSRYDRLNELLSSASEIDSQKLLEEHGEIHSWLEHHGGWNTDYRIETVLTHLKIKDKNQPISVLSGGWRKRVALAKLILQSPDLLLLDEPTNHLDAETTEWLEGYLKSYPGALMLITHDRYFLDNVVKQMFELEKGKIPCYSGSAVKARSLTIVRLDTGAIVQTFRQSAAEVTLPAPVINVSQLDSPITGQPVAFPADAGAVADRIFVGDQDGSLWKVDLSSQTPSDWKMTLFFDAYAKTPGYNVGQPIATPAILSVNDRNEITVNLSTGDQDALGAAPSMVNYVWSLTEKPVALSNGDTGSFKTTVNWYKPLSAGERVTGPMVLFNSMLFFSTFKPTSGACSVGESIIWSMDYIRPASGVDSGGAPTGAFATIDPTAVSISVDDQLLGLQAGDPTDRAAVFGVSLVQKPTCRVNDSSAVNQYLGYRSHTALTDVTPGTFQLMFHIGGASPSSSVPGVSQSQGNANALAMDLPAPQSFSRVDSWAAIVE